MSDRMEEENEDDILEEILDYANAGEYVKSMALIKDVNWNTRQWNELYANLIEYDNEILAQDSQEGMYINFDDMTDEITGEIEKYLKEENAYVKNSEFHKFVIDAIKISPVPIIYNEPRIIRDTFYHIFSIEELKILLPYNNFFKHISQNLYLYKIYQILTEVFVDSKEYKAKFLKYQELDKRELFNGKRIKRKLVNRLFYITPNCMDILLDRKVLEGYENINEYMNDCMNDFDTNMENKKRSRDDEETILPKRIKY